MDTLTVGKKVYRKADSVLSNSCVQGKIKVSNSARRKPWVSWLSSVVGSFHSYLPKNHTELGTGVSIKRVSDDSNSTITGRCTLGLSANVQT